MTRKIHIALTSLFLLFAAPLSAQAFTSFNISNDNVVGATVSPYTEISTEWRLGTHPEIIQQTSVFAPIGTKRGTPIDISNGDMDCYGTSFLRVIIDTNEYSDYGGRIYLRNWDQTAERHMTTDPNDPNQLKGLVHENGQTVVPMKWAVRLPGGNPSMQLRVVYRRPYEDSDFWRWFLDPTYGEDSDFFTNQDKLDYATFITGDQIDFFNNPAADIYLIARFPHMTLAGDYRTTTITVEVYYE